MLDAYGHACIWIAERQSWRGRPDHDHLELLSWVGADIYMSLDWNREPQVWPEVLGRLAQGIGRMLRIKLKAREVPDIPTLTRYWARAYDKVAPSLVESAAKLIQVGMRIDTQRSEADGVRMYSARELAQMTQQQMTVHAGSLRRRGTPAINVPPGRGRPPKV